MNTKKKAILLYLEKVNSATVTDIKDELELSKIEIIPVLRQMQDKKDVTKVRDYYKIDSS